MTLSASVRFSHPPALYLREDAIIRPVDEFLRDELTGRSLTDNLRRVAEAQHRAALAAYGDGGEIEKLRQAIADADRKINGYRATLDAGGGPTLIAGWIAETTAIKKTAQARLGLIEAPPQRMTVDQLDAIAEAFNDLLGLLRDADPRDRAELYSRLGLRMTYRPGPETVIAEVVTPANLRVFDTCPEIDTYRIPTRRLLGFGSCPMIDTNRYPSYCTAIYYYSTPIAHEETVRKEFGRVPRFGSPASSRQPVSQQLKRPAHVGMLDAPVIDLSLR